ncbi:MAG: hypothetical protein KJ077_08790 [Anaerolineae bacterium]|nr:hypothetical protein [Anaerolineae bacterium]
MKAFGNYFIGLARPGMNARAMEQRRVNPALARLIGRCGIVRRLYRRTSTGGKVAAAGFRSLSRDQEAGNTKLNRVP